MNSFQVVREDLPAEVNKELHTLFVGKWLPNYGLYGPKKYFVMDSFHKPLFELIPHMKLRPDDVWIGGFPRSGTHWLAEMTWLINNNLDFDKARRILNKDRVKRFECIDLIDGDVTPPTMELYDQLPSSRFFKTHLPLSLLPPKLLETSKLVYVARDPRDTLLSWYHFIRRGEVWKFNGSLQELFDLFVSNNNEYCPYFDNVLEYWNARHHENLLFLFYEDLVKDLSSTVRRIAQFFDKKFSESQYEHLCEYLQIENMKKNETFNTKKFYSHDVQLIQTGKIGGWQEAFTEDMKNQAKKWMDDNLKDTDFSFNIS